MPLTISETRTGELPVPYIDAPVGLVAYDGHEVDVWSIATTAEGKVIYLNCSAADAALSATLRHLLRNSGGKVIFQPAKGVSWSGPTEVSKLPDHYTTLTQALTHQGMRLKNQCIIPDSLNIAAGLSRPMETSSPIRVSPSPNDEKARTEEADGAGSPDVESPDAEQPDTPSGAWSYRYILGDAATDCPPTGALFAHLQSLVVVCHPTWEAALWEHGQQHALILPQPALGIHAWSMTRERARWTDLIGTLWMRGTLARPAPTPLLSARTRRSSAKK